MTKQERIAGLFFILFGFFVSIYSVWALSVGSIKQPGPGLFPLVCGIGIIIMCLIWLFRGRMSEFCSEPLWPEGEWKRPAAAVVVLIGYTAVWESLGYALSTLLFMIAWQVLIEQANWRRTAAISVICTAAMYILFVYLLGVSLPAGLIGE